MSVVLVSLTAWEAGRGWLRLRDRYRADILWTVGLLAPILLLGDRALGLTTRGSWPGFVVSLLFLLQPFFLLRLVSRFRVVRPAVIWITGGIAIAGAAAGSLWHPGTAGGWTPIVAAYFAVQLAYAAHSFGRESQRASGVTGARLWFAALGTWLHVAIAVVLGAEALNATMVDVGAGIRQILGLGVFASYYAGLVAPRPLRAIWAQRELYRHVRDTATRQPADRLREAPADLQRAAGHGVASVARAVLLFDDERPGLLTTRAANISSWCSLEVRPDAGLIARALSRGTPVVGAPADYEAPLRAVAANAGQSVIAVPIQTAARRWGVFILVQRHGSLFPDDDLEFLSVLCQHTAATLEHARLVDVERQHQAQTAAAALRDREARFGQILEHITDYAVIVLDDKGHIREWKAGAQTIFGHTVEDAVGRSVAEIFGIDDARLMAVLDAARRDGRTDIDGEGRRKNGALVFAHSTVQRLASDTSGLTGFVVVTRDETERRAMSERLQQAQKMEAVGQLAGGVAHDFNNLLTGMLGYAAAIESHPGYDRALDLHLGEIRRVAERATSLTRRLLAFSRREVVQPTLVNLTDVVADLMPMLERVLDEDAHVQPMFHPTAPAAWLVACPTQLEQIVLNLAVNGRDAMPEGGRLSIRTALRHIESEQQVGDAMLPAGTYAALIVEDQGTGIEPAVQARMFEPFFTTKEAGRGTGLGLSTVYGIVKQTGGGIHVDSAAGRGTRFEILFPSAPEPVAPARSTASARAALDGGETVLLVEDDAPIRSLVTTWLKRRGYRTLVAADAGEARTIAASAGPIDLVVTDVMMPGGSGPDLVAALRESDADIAAIFMSGYAHATLTTEGHLPADTHLVSKPFTETELISRVRAVLDRAIAAAAHPTAP